MVWLIIAMLVAAFWLFDRWAASAHPAYVEPKPAPKPQHKHNRTATHFDPELRAYLWAKAEKEELQIAKAWPPTPLQVEHIEARYRGKCEEVGIAYR